MKKNSTIRKIIYVVGLLLFAISVNSCMKNDVSIKEPDRYTSQDIQSYGDLFKTFWTVMNDRYNYFYEQKRKDGMDWDKVYQEYYPKFAALKSYKLGDEFKDSTILNDAAKAKQYFTDIIDPIIDRHFVLRVYLPVSRASYETNQFSGGMKDLKANPPYSYDNVAKYALMKTKLVDPLEVNSFTQSIFGSYPDDFMVAGYLKSNPDIYYITFPQFNIISTVLLLDSKYFTPDGTVTFTNKDIESNTDLKAVKDANNREKLRTISEDVLAQFTTFVSTNADEVKKFNTQLAEFQRTEIMTDDFKNTAADLYDKISYMPIYSYETFTLDEYLGDDPAALKYYNWFRDKMSTYAQTLYGLSDFGSALQMITLRADYYQKLLNPLHKGAFKKIIIDIRGNGGGAVLDFRVFGERLVTKSAIVAYQRTKEGNSRFDYTPWIPVEAKPHKFGMPNNIPIAILTDRNSVSMSELSTLMWRSQGSQVISVGDYTRGGTAGLGANDNFNGGLSNAGGIQAVGTYLQFYMPLMATKDASGTVIEGVGVKPNILVTPLTKDEAALMTTAPESVVDRTLNAAIEALNKM